MLRCESCAWAMGAVVWAGCASDGAAPAAMRSLPDSAVVYRNDFDGAPLGTYTLGQLRADWRNPAWENGVSQGRAVIVDEPDAFSGHALRILYPAGGVGPSQGGAQWQLRFDRGHAELFLSYRIKFGPGFGFVKGGKIPGLAGGAANTGGHPPTGTDGWSGRMMWREGGKVVQYVYHPDQGGTYGQDLPWSVGGQRVFTPGTWHQVEHRVVMNTPGKRDGLVQGWFDGVLALDVSGLRFRDVDSFAIDLFYFSTFFGGDDPTWAPARDEVVTFDDFVIATQPISH